MVAAKSVIFLYISQLLRVWVPNYTLYQILSDSDSVLGESFPFLTQNQWLGYLGHTQSCEMQATQMRWRITHIPGTRRHPEFYSCTFRVSTPPGPGCR